jgi:hypothetical protein
VFSPLLQRASTFLTIVQPSSPEGLYIIHKYSAIFYRGPQLNSQVFSSLVQRASTLSV